LYKGALYIVPNII